MTPETKEAAVKASEWIDPECHAGCDDPCCPYVHQRVPRSPSKSQAGTPEGVDTKLIARTPTDAMMQAGLYQSSHDAEWQDVYSAWVDMWDAAEPAPSETKEASWLRCTECGNLIHPEEETLLGDVAFHLFCAEGFLARATLHPAPSSEEGEKAVGHERLREAVKFFDDLEGPLPEDHVAGCSDPYWDELLAAARAALSQTEDQGGGAAGNAVERGLLAMIDALNSPIPDDCAHYQEAVVRAVLATVSTPVSDPKDLEAELREAREALARFNRDEELQTLMAINNDLLSRAKGLEAGLRAIAEGNLGDQPWQANYDRIRETARTLLARLEKKGEE